VIRRDLEATAKAKFFNGRSYIRPDGRQHLFGIDMELRRKQVWERCKGRCEICHNQVAEDYGELHHDKPRSRGGDDSAKNLLFICKPCHRAKHNREPRLKRIA
jgi:5-methylcytosine-specific restriction endonuclease McrA